MSPSAAPRPAQAAPADPSLSLFQLLDPSVHADPHPFYRRLREEAPVHWDPFMHTWVVTRYEDVHTVLHQFSADRTPNPDQMKALGLPSLGPVADVMAKQMLFLDAPAHTRLRKLCSSAFTPRRVEAMEEQIQEIADTLIDAVIDRGQMDVIADFAEPFPAIVTAGLLGVPREDHGWLKAKSADFAEMLGNFQHNPDRVHRVLKSVAELTDYFRDAIRNHGDRPGLVRSLVEAEVDGNRLSEDEVIANTIVTMVGGQETTTNLIGNGLLTLIRNPDKLAELRDEPHIIATAVEELLRFETPSQHTARIAHADTEIGGRLIRKGEAVMAVMASGNRDPRRFADPDRLDLRRTENRHLAFGWAAHFCFGAALARMEARIAFTTLLRRLDDLALASDRLEWRPNSGLRGLQALPITFRAVGAAA
ncbi:cytochrome P450 [Sphingosinicella sp. BN140058]|uniref:cytochrome P450 n=1 Tax=Sphingosinicella sp. BN140058 TaxID=1892855 RepID=UPI0010103065|nr:cytochrome P450 [Sphingosinicella sp. BN140058]QAY79199.1 cytochrome P450 [Sphingosinicella sp. BN140058]